MNRNHNIAKFIYNSSFDGFLEKLKILSAFNCRKLKSFPPIKLTSLKLLTLSFCDSLESFPEILGKMENVTQLCLENTPIKKFPLSFQNLTKLQELRLGYSKELRIRGCDAVMLQFSFVTFP